MFLKSFIASISLSVTFFITMAATVVSAQEVIQDENAYERYVSRVPNLPILEGGGSADLLVEYFASPQGHVANTNYIAINSVQNDECKIYFRPNGDICYCANTPPGFLGCVGSNDGPNGGTLQVVDLIVQVAPELNPTGELLSFSMNIKTVQSQTVGRFKVEGVNSSAVASQLRLEIMK